MNKLNTLKDKYNPGRIIFTSSISTFHQNGGEWVTEVSETCPVKFNGKVKAGQKSPKYTATGFTRRTAQVLLLTLLFAEPWITCQLPAELNNPQ